MLLWSRIAGFSIIVTLVAGFLAMAPSTSKSFIVSSTSTVVAQETPDFEVAQREVPDREIEESLNFWSLERMKEAEAIPEPQEPGRDVTPPPPRIRGERVRGSRPEESVAVRPHHNTTTVSPPYRDYPNSTVGVLFFGSSSRCTAAVVTSGDRRSVWTAGHCVYKNGSWHNNMIFVPAYDGTASTLSNAAPFGRWPATRLISLVRNPGNAWVDGENPHYDLGAVDLINRSGNRIGDVTGTLGFSWGQPRGLTYDAVGYPIGGTQFSGNTQIACYDRSLRTARTYGGAGPPMQVITCHVTGGASGGPWVQNDFQENCPACFINSVHSRGGPEPEAGPYHATGARILWQSLP